jgi:hypothetical protein
MPAHSQAATPHTARSDQQLPLQQIPKATACQVRIDTAGHLSRPTHLRFNVNHWLDFRQWSSGRKWALRMVTGLYRRRMRCGSCRQCQID